MRGEHDCAAAPPASLRGRARRAGHGPPGRGRHAARRAARAGRRRPTSDGEGGAAPLAGRELADRHRRPAGHRSRAWLEQPGATSASRSPAARRAKREVLLHRELLVEERLVTEKPTSRRTARRSAARSWPSTMASPEWTARGPAEPEQAGLAGAVRAGEMHDLAFADVERLLRGAGNGRRGRRPHVDRRRAPWRSPMLRASRSPGHAGGRQAGRPVVSASSGRLAAQPVDVGIDHHRRRARRSRPRSSSRVCRVPCSASPTRKSTSAGRMNARRCGRGPRS